MKTIINRLRQLISQKEITPKIVSLLLSVILWAYISSTKVGELKFRIPIRFENLRKTLVVSEYNKKYIRVFLKGKKDDLKNINTKNIKAFINLGHPLVGKSKRYPIEVSREGIPESVNLDISANEVLLTIEKIVSKKVKIAPNVTGNPAEGHILENINVAPEYAIIRGPQSIVKNIDAVETTNISIEKETGNVTKEISLNNKFFRNVRLDISNAIIFIKIKKDTNTKQLKKQIEIRNAKKEYNFLLNNENVIVFIRVQDKDVSLSEEDIDIFIDTSSVDIEDLFKNTNKNYINKDFLIQYKTEVEEVINVSLKPDIVSVKIIKLEKQSSHNDKSRGITSENLNMEKQ